MDGCKALRVLTNLKKITENRQFAEDVVDRKILAIHAAQTKSKLVQKNATSKISDKLSIYLRRLAPKKDDDFEIETFDEIDRDLSIIQTSATRYNEARRNISSIVINKIFFHKNNFYYIYIRIFFYSFNKDGLWFCVGSCSCCRFKCI